MQRISQRKTARPKPRRAARKAPAQHAANGFSQGAHVPTHFPLFPRQLQFSSNWNRTIEVDIGASQFQWAIGLFDYLNYIPEYALEMYRLYRYSRICAVDVTLSVVGESDEANQNFAYEAAIAKIPFDQVGLTPSALKLVRGSKYALTPTSGMNKCTLRGHFGSFDELGNPVYDRTYWQTLSDAQSTTPADQSRPVVGMSVRVINGNRGVVSINVSVTYHMQFFELEYNRIPELTVRPDNKSKPQTAKVKRPLSTASPAYSVAQEPGELSFEDVDPSAGIYKLKRK